MTSAGRIALLMTFVPLSNCAVGTAEFAYDVEYVARPLLKTHFHKYVYPVMLRAYINGSRTEEVSDQSSMDFIRGMVPVDFNWTPQAKSCLVSSILDSLMPERISADLDRVNRPEVFSSGPTFRVIYTEFTMHSYVLILKFYFHKILLELIDPTRRNTIINNDCLNLQSFLRGDFRHFTIYSKAKFSQTFNYFGYFEIDQLLLVMPRILDSETVELREYHEILYTVVDLFSTIRISADRLHFPIPSHIKISLRETVDPVKKTFFKSLASKRPKLLRTALGVYFKLMGPEYSLCFIKEVIFPFVDQLVSTDMDTSSIELYVSALESAIQQLRRTIYDGRLPCILGSISIVRNIWDQNLRMGDRVTKLDDNLHMAISTAAVLSQMATFIQKI